MSDELLTLDELVAWLKVPRATIYRWSSRGEVPSIRLGRWLRFRRSAIETWLGEKERDMGSAAMSSTLRVVKGPRARSRTGGPG